MQTWGNICKSFQIRLMFITIPSTSVSHLHLNVRLFCIIYFQLNQSEENTIIMIRRHSHAIGWAKNRLCKTTEHLDASALACPTELNKLPNANPYHYQSSKTKFKTYLRFTMIDLSVTNFVQDSLLNKES
jgi:hypothetical protein